MAFLNAKKTPSARFEAQPGPNGWWDVIDRSNAGDPVALCFQGVDAESAARAAAAVMNEAAPTPQNDR